MSRRDIAVEVVADPRLLTLVRNLVRGYVDSFGFAKDRVDEVVLAVDEACTNTIRHAYGGACKKVYWLSMASSHGWLEFVLRDEGKPAPKEAVASPDADAAPDLEKLVPGGLGLRLIYGVFDDVRFSSGKDRGNCVIMKLRRPPASQKASGEGK